MSRAHLDDSQVLEISIDISARLPRAPVSVWLAELDRLSTRGIAYADLGRVADVLRTFRAQDPSKERPAYDGFLQYRLVSNPVPCSSWLRGFFATSLKFRGDHYINHTTFSKSMDVDRGLYKRVEAILPQIDYVSVRADGDSSFGKVVELFSDPENCTARELYLDNTHKISKSILDPTVDILMWHGWPNTTRLHYEELTGSGLDATSFAQLPVLNGLTSLTLRTGHDASVLINHLAMSGANDTLEELTLLRPKPHTWDAPHTHTECSALEGMSSAFPKLKHLTVPDDMESVIGEATFAALATRSPLETLEVSGPGYSAGMIVELLCSHGALPYVHTVHGMFRDSTLVHYLAENNKSPIHTISFPFSVTDMLDACYALINSSALPLLKHIVIPFNSSPIEDQLEWSAKERGISIVRGSRG